MNIYLENQIRLMRELHNYFLKRLEDLEELEQWKRADAEWEYAEAEGRAQQKRRERGELNEDLGDENVLARHGFVGEEL